MWPSTPAVRRHLAQRCRTCCLRRFRASRPPQNSSFRGSIPHPIRSLCTLRTRRRRRLRNTRFPAARYHLTGSDLSPAETRQLRLTHRNRKFESISLQRRVICEPGPERPAALVHDRTSDLVIIAWRRPSPVRLSLPPAAAISICISARILRSVIRATPTGDVHIPPAGTDGPRRTRRGEGTRRTLGTGLAFVDISCPSPAP